MINFYEILEIKPASDYKEIKEAYWRLSKKFHPDLNNGDKLCEEKFKTVLEAYSVLKDPAKRKLFDLRYKAYKESRYSSANKRKIAPNQARFDFPGTRKNVKYSKHRSKTKVQLSKKEKYWAASGAGFLLIIILLILSLERSLYKREAYLEMNDTQTEVPDKDSLNLIQGFKDDSISPDKKVFIKTFSQGTKR